MRRAVALALAALALSPAVAAARTPTTAVGVGLREFQLSLYRDRVRPGVVKFNLTNFGEDPHDLVVRTRAGRIVARAAEVPAGDRATERIRLRLPGRYVVFCSIADHEEQGMRARLTVSRRAKL